MGQAGFSPETAEVFALGVLSWLVGNDELLPVFLGASGTNEADLRARVQDREFLGSVLDFLLMDDAWIIAYCEATGAKGEDVMLARAALPGGEAVHWT